MEKLPLLSCQSLTPSIVHLVASQDWWHILAPDHYKQNQKKAGKQWEWDNNLKKKRETKVIYLLGGGYWFSAQDTFSCKRKNTS